MLVYKSLLKCILQVLKGCWVHTKNRVVLSAFFSLVNVPSLECNASLV